MDRASILNSYFNKFELLENVVITGEIIDILLKLPGEYSKLVTAVKSLLGQQEIPNNPEMYHRLGEKLYENHMDIWDPPHSFSAILIPFMLAATQSDNVKHQYRLAELYWESEDSEHSILILEKLLFDNLHPPSSLLLAEILMDRSDYTMGVNLLNQVLGIDPYNTRANFLLGDYYRKKDEFERSEMYLLKTVGKKDGITWGDMVEFYQQIDNEGKTIDAFNQMVGIDGSAFNKLQFAKYLIEIGRNEQVVELLQEISGMELYHELEQEVSGLLDKYI